MGAIAHGHNRRGQRSPTYNSYRAMVERCTYQTHPYYMDYGGRGIAVDARWLGSGGFVNFLDDMGNRPAGKTLDRIDVDAGYGPANCRWADKVTQRWNRRDMAAQLAYSADHHYETKAEHTEPDMPF